MHITLLAAAESGMHGIGGELSQEYCDIAAQRMQEHLISLN